MDTGPGFLGTGWAFPPAFDGAACAAALVAAEEDVHQALRILLSTNPGERVMRPTWGGGLRRMVFEHLDQSTITALRDSIEQAVRFHEPRVELDGVDVDLDARVEGLLRLTLRYTLRRTNTRHNLVFPFYLDPSASAAEDP